jgi:transposase-like protein
MYKCNKCNKEFKYESKLNEHSKRKIPCNAVKKEYKCELCNVNFVDLLIKKSMKKLKNI